MMGPRGRIGILGLGDWGQNHLHTLTDLVEYDQIVGCDTEKERVRGFAGQYPDVTFTTDPDTVLEDPDLDAVVIATPAPTHADLARQAIEAGKDVLVEKPMTLSSVDAEKLSELADREDAVLMVGHLLLYQKALDVIREAIDEGTIGEIQSLHQVRRKLGTVRENENVLWSFGVHDLAVFLDLVGEPPERVEATGLATHQGAVEDAVHLDLTFPGGVHAHLHTSWIWPETERRLTIVGTDGVLRYDELEGQLTRFDRGIEEDLSTFDHGQEILAEVDDEPLTREVKHFLECVVGRLTPISDGHQGVRVLEILEEADRRMNIHE